MALTFTNKAANEMKERIESYNIYDTDHIWMSTFHSCCARILRMNAEKIGYTSQYKILDSADQKSVIRNILKEMNQNLKDNPPAKFVGEISKYKNAGKTPKDLMEEGVPWDKELTLKVYREYENRLKRYNSMDYDDLILNAIKLLKENPEVLEYYQRKFRYILVDEFQDSNKPQYEFVKLIAQGHRNICVCGDDDQSIVRPSRVA